MHVLDFICRRFPLPEGWISCYCLLEVTVYAQCPSWRPSLFEVVFGPALAEPDFRMCPSVWFNSRKMENTLFFSWKIFSSFTLTSMSTFCVWLRANSLSVCLGRYMVMLTEMKKKSSELSVCSNCKQDSAKYSDHGFFEKWQIQNSFPIYVWALAPFTCLPQLPFTCGDRTVF